ncbi:hypothetical protein M408DRAFT_64370, partial [Serendipita vermifera MAFF 305830]
HGIKRTKVDAAAIAARREKEKEKLRAYLESEKEILDLKEANEWSEAALQLTEQFLNTNPEHYTIWNYRRDIFTKLVFVSWTPEDAYQRLVLDLRFTTSALKRYPKVYWIWNHRRWCLENTPSGPGTEPDSKGEEGIDGWEMAVWSQEVLLVEKMLSLDERNFHAWDYRRYILSHCPPSLRRSDADELAYTTRRIEKNHSNFSAWHQRSLVYTSLWKEDPSQRAPALDQEFELVKNALWMAPDDQSGWLYHRWLVGSGDDVTILEKEIGVIEELLEVEPESRWTLDTLVYYKRLLMKHRSEQGKRQLVEECRRSLETLCRIDPMRRRRYEDIGKRILEAYSYNVAYNIQGATL